MKKQKLKLVGMETGIDDDGNKVMSHDDKKSEWITPTKLRLPDGKITTIDPNEMSFEALNRNKFTVVWENVHPSKEDRIINPNIIHRPNTHALIPHRYYAPWVEKIGIGKNEPIEILEITGSEMFKNQTKASRPEPKK